MDQPSLTLFLAFCGAHQVSGRETFDKNLTLLLLEDSRNPRNLTQEIGISPED